MADREVKLFMWILYVPAAVWLDGFFISWEFDNFHEVEQLPEYLFFSLIFFICFELTPEEFWNGGSM